MALTMDWDAFTLITIEDILNEGKAAYSAGTGLSQEQARGYASRVANRVWRSFSRVERRNLLDSSGQGSEVPFQRAILQLVIEFGEAEAGATGGTNPYPADGEDIS